MDKNDEDDKAAARRILEESQELGELLCEEEKDVMYVDYPNMF